MVCYHVISRLKRKWMTSFGSHSAFMFAWMHTLHFFVYMEALVSFLLID